MIKQQNQSIKSAMLFSKNHQIGTTINNLKITLDNFKTKDKNLIKLNSKQILLKIYLLIKRSANKKLI